MSERTAYPHLQMLNAEMIRTMTIPTAELEDAYTDLLNLAYAMYYDLADAERRISELEQKEQKEEKTRCPTCGGKGTHVHFVERSNVAVNKRCGRCGGKGYLEGEGLGHKPSEAQ